MKRGQTTISVITILGALATWSSALSWVSFNDHATLTASVGDISTMKDDIKDIKRVIYNAAPNWGINPNAGESTSTRN